MIRSLVLAVFVAALGAVLAPLAAAAASLETPATHAILIENETGTVLLEKAADEPMPPASMLKLMTVYMVFERLVDGSLSLDDTLPVSEKAWRMGGSKMFVQVGTRISVADLLRGIIVQSGNDACIVIAEALAGSEQAFAEEMTRRGREIGLEDSVFRTATGWPDPDQHMTVRDIATLSRLIIKKFPQYYELFSEKNFTYNDIRQGNRNPLLYKDMGADGLKTGHTEESGYGLAASVVHGDRRLILVVSGLDSVNARARESERILEWGVRNFDNYTLFKPGETVEQADVWLGVKSKVPLVIDDGLTVTMHRKSRREMKAVVVYDGPIPSPIEAGQEVATLTISAPDTDPLEIPLHAGEAVKRLGFVGRIGAALSYLVWGGR